MKIIKLAFNERSKGCKDGYKMAAQWKHPLLAARRHILRRGCIVKYSNTVTHQFTFHGSNLVTIWVTVMSNCRPPQPLIGFLRRLCLSSRTQTVMSCSLPGKHTDLFSLLPVLSWSSRGRHSSTVPLGSAGWTGCHQAAGKMCCLLSWDTKTTTTLRQLEQHTFNNKECTCTSVL